MENFYIIINHLSRYSARRGLPRTPLGPGTQNGKPQEIAERAQASAQAPDDTGPLAA